MLEGLIQIGAAVEARVTPEKVVARALDLIDARLETAEEIAKHCSYKAVLGLYTSCKILRHHLNKAYHEVGFEQAAVVLKERIIGQDTRIEKLRETMYDNVCLSCEACKSRRSGWPTHTKFTRGRSWPSHVPVSIHDGAPGHAANANRMMYRKETDGDTSYAGTQSRFVIEDEYAIHDEKAQTIRGEITAPDIYAMMKAALDGKQNVEITVTRPVGMMPELAMGYNGSPAKWAPNRYMKR